MKQMPLFSKKSPCNSCPYKLITPLRHWSIEEFKDLLAKEKDFLGTTYMCHKKDGCICVGFLMNQDKRNFPSIALRIQLSKHNVNRTYLDSLKSKSKMFDTVEQMCYTNFPELKHTTMNPTKAKEYADKTWAPRVAVAAHLAGQQCEADETKRKAVDYHEWISNPLGNYPMGCTDIYDYWLENILKKKKL